MTTPREIVEMDQTETIDAGHSEKSGGRRSCEGLTLTGTLVSADFKPDDFSNQYKLEIIVSADDTIGFVPCAVKMTFQPPSPFRSIEPKSEDSA